MPTGTQTAVVRLEIPCHAEFVSVARLATAALANQANLSYEEVQDLRVAVSEACAAPVRRTACGNAPNSRITISATVSDGEIYLQIKDNATVSPLEPCESDEDEEHSLGLLLMQLLVDDLHIEQTSDGGTLVTMTKRARWEDGGV